MSMLLRRRMMHPAADDYITDGLVMFLDGLNRGGVSGEWHDLIDDTVVVTLTNATEGRDGVTFTNGSSATSYGTFSKYVSVSYTVGTIESVTELNAIEVTGRTIMSMQTNGTMGGTVASTGTDGYPVARYYVSNATVNAYKFTNNAPTTKLIISCNDDRGYCNGQAGTKYNTGAVFSGGSGYWLARKANNNNPFNGVIHAIRLYNRKLTAEEILHNQRIDNARYHMGLTI